MRALCKSFGYAFEGLWYAVSTQRNLRIHFSAAALVIWLALLLEIDGARLGVLLLTIGAVIAAELFNTAAETCVDLSVKGYHPKAKIAKDTAAAAVLVTALAAVGVGLAVFLSPETMEKLRRVVSETPNRLIWGGVIALLGLIAVAVPECLKKRNIKK